MKEEEAANKQLKKLAAEILEIHKYEKDNINYNEVLNKIKFKSFSKMIYCRQYYSDIPV